MITVSIIIPVYQGKSYLKRCIDSVLAQSCQEYEIILVDDGSTDGSAEICDEYAEKQKTITVIHKENGGLSSARNAGLEIASGEYVMFIDADDVVHSKMLETELKVLKEENADIAHCGYQMVFPDRVDYYYNTGKRVIQTKEQGLKDLLAGEMIEPALYNKLYKRELFENVRLNESLKINEDLDVNYRLFKKSQKSIYYDLPLYSYMIRKNSATGSNTVIRKNEDSLKVLEQIKNDCKSEKEIYSIAYRRYVYLLMAICRMDIDQITYQKSKRDILKKELKTKDFKQYISSKLKIMSWLSCYFPAIIKLIYKAYDLKTGTSKKYKVDEG